MPKIEVARGDRKAPMNMAEEHPGEENCRVGQVPKEGAKSKNCPC